MGAAAAGRNVFGGLLGIEANLKSTPALGRGEEHKPFLLNRNPSSPGAGVPKLKAGAGETTSRRLWAMVAQPPRHSL
ncbi:MAG: hypothetical protein O7A08_06305, partial [SAR324 cluster bacterium]|nr:hypothetical protein [SAR324 cluster bacterium]